MCGLVGVIGKIGAKEKTVLEQMLIFDVVRGKHSTGLAGVDSKGEFSSVKVADVPHGMFDTKAYDKLRGRQNYVLMGHNRYATKGAVNKKNAHPFEFDDVIGCHNGTIRGQWRLPNYKEFEVDSENIFYAIQTEGVEATLEKLDGAYALSYWDKRAQQFVLLRNSERPMFYAYSVDRQTMFYASEAWMVTVACARENVKIENIKQLSVNTIHRFTIDMVPGQNSKPIEEEEQPFEPFVAPVKPNVTYGGGRQNAQPFRGSQQSGNKSSTTSRPKTKAEQELEEMRNKTHQTFIQFEVVKDAKTHLNQQYVSCIAKGVDKFYEVRVFASPSVNADLHRDMHDQDDCLFEGQVVACGIDPDSTDNRPYFIVNYRTVKVVDEDEEEDVNFTLPALSNSSQGRMAPFLKRIGKLWYSVTDVHGAQTYPTPASTKKFCG